MNNIEESDRTAAGATVLPVLIQIQGPLPLAPAPNARKRRIYELLDHPMSRHLGIFSWALVGVAAAATRPLAAVVLAILVFVGLLIGVINGLRWLLGPK
jgi:hypothetical protein